MNESDQCRKEVKKFKQFQNFAVFAVFKALSLMAFVPETFLELSQLRGNNHEQEHKH
jgi:hypothetical protein